MYQGCVPIPGPPGPPGSPGTDSTVPGPAGPAGSPGPPGASNAVYTQEWTWSSQTAVPPNNSQIRTDSGEWATATTLYIDANSNDGADRSAALALIRAGDELQISQRTDSSRWAKWSVAADSIDRAGYWEISIAYLDGAGTISNSGAGVILNLLTTGATAVVVADEATVLPRRAVLAFVGEGVTVTDDAANDRTIVTIAAATLEMEKIGLFTSLGNPPDWPGSTEGTFTMSSKVNRVANNILGRIARSWYVTAWV